MWSVTVVLALIGSASAIIDGNCTVSGKYAPNAAICSNKYTDSTCNQIYASSTVAAGGSDERPAACFNGTNGIDDDVKALAISACAKTCGYCCETPAYNCLNKRQPRIQCNTITRSMCDSTQWRPIIAEDCPAACGFCLDGGCIDVAPDCKSQPMICQTIGMEAFVAANCQRTCEKCPTTGTGTATTRAPTTVTCPNARDTNNNCASWVKNGFCTNTFYTLQQRKDYCGKSCNLC